jgi:hypothetical protein
MNRELELDMSAGSEPSALDLEVAADQAIATYGGDDLEAMKALLVAVDFLEAPGRRPPGGGSDRLARPRYDVQRDRDPEVRRRTRGPGAL